MSLSRRTLLQGSAASIAAASVAPAFAAQPKDEGFILGPGPAGRCDDAKVGGPYVIWSEEDQNWRLYYYCRSKSFPEGVAPAFGTGSIAMATSADGVHWERHKGHLEGGAIFTPSDDESAFDAMHVGIGNVIRNGDEWVMSYFGGDATIPTELGGTPISQGYQFKGYRCRPGVARSSDGINWTRVAGPGYGGAAVDIGDDIYGAFPSIFFNGEEYILYHTALSPKYFYWDTKIASSTDLVSWKDRGSLQWERGAQSWETGGLVTRHVMRNPFRRGKKWLMVYTALDANYPLYTRRVGIADSDDGITWTQKYKDPIFFPAEAHQWDGGGTAYAQLVRNGKNFHLYYYGFAHGNNKSGVQRGIGLAVSDGSNLQTLRRVRL